MDRKRKRTSNPIASSVNNKNNSLNTAPMDDVDTEISVAKRRKQTIQRRRDNSVNDIFDAMDVDNPMNTKKNNKKQNSSGGGNRSKKPTRPPPSNLSKFEDELVSEYDEFQYEYSNNSEMWNDSNSNSSNRFTVTETSLVPPQPQSPKPSKGNVSILPFKRSNSVNTLVTTVIQQSSSSILPPQSTTTLYSKQMDAQEIKKYSAIANKIAEAFRDHPIHTFLLNGETISLRVKDPTTEKLQIINTNGITERLKLLYWPNVKHSRLKQPTAKESATSFSSFNKQITTGGMKDKLKGVVKNSMQGAIVDCDDIEEKERMLSTSSVTTKSTKEEPTVIKGSFKYNMQESKNRGTETHKKMEVFIRVYIMELAKNGHHNNVIKEFDNQMSLWSDKFNYRTPLGSPFTDDIAIIVDTLMAYQMIPIFAELPVINHRHLNRWRDIQVNTDVYLQRLRDVIQGEQEEERENDKQDISEDENKESISSLLNEKELLKELSRVFATRIDLLCYCHQINGLVLFEYKTTTGSFLDAPNMMEHPLEWMKCNALNRAIVQTAVGIHYFKQTYRDLLTRMGIKDIRAGIIYVKPGETVKTMPLKNRCYFYKEADYGKVLRCLEKSNSCLI